MRQSSLASGQPGRGGGRRTGGRPGPPAARARPSRSRPGPPAASAQMQEHSRARRQGFAPILPEMLAHPCTPALCAPGGAPPGPPRRLPSAFPVAGSVPETVVLLRLVRYDTLRNED